MADLWERLQAAKAKKAQESQPEPAPESAGPAPEGWRWTAPLVAERRLRFELEPRFLQALGGLDLGQWNGVYCFDTETTGLSGGAGTVPFLIGWAELLTGAVPSVEVRQWFLRDHPGEPDLIAAVDEAWGRARGLVSFNGASFDLPLLRGRWALAGKTLASPPHRDALHPSRRLWKRLLESCRLSSLEESVLGIGRVDDVPGSLVPELWFGYLRAGAAADFATPLEGVLRHHAQDVYSLLCLDLLLASMNQDPQSERWVQSLGPAPRRSSIARPVGNGLLHPDLGPTTAVDFWGLLALKEENEADRSLEAGWAAWDDTAVALAWAGRLKRRGDVRAVAIWRELWTKRTSYAALEELLKWQEHREKTPEAWRSALTALDEALKAPFLPRVWREGLEKRRGRLMKRLSSTGDAPKPGPEASAP